MKLVCVRALKVSDEVSLGVSEVSSGLIVGVKHEKRMIFV